MREIYLQDNEMLAIAETAQSCVDLALRHDWAVVSDRSVHSQIPHRNGLRDADFRLAMRDTTFSSLDIDLPRKDEDIRIRITAHAQDLPNRTVVFDEFAEKDEHGERGFFVNDSHALAFARIGGRPVSSYMSQTEVASWLYMQAGIDQFDAIRRIRRESDPVRNACDILAADAKQHLAVRQLKVGLSPDLELHGQLVEAFDPANPFAEPLARKYTAWVNKHHVIDGQPVTERLFVEFSPDDVLLGTDISPISRATVMLDTSHPAFALGKAVARQALDYEDGGVLDTFQVIEQRLSRLYQASGS